MTETKRQDLPSPDGTVGPAGLWVVATPIGNLSDLSERARRALENADGILCEDTRRTARLMAALALSKPLYRHDAHAKPQELARWVRRMEEGETFALVTDAGTPAISDPAAALVRLVRASGILVTPVPGPSALVALLSVAGFEENEFAFRGFFPRKESDAKEELERVARAEVARVFAWFESPERIERTVELIAEKLPECEVFAAKELTKLNERYFFGAAGDVRERITAEIEREGRRGEWCFAIRLEPYVEKRTESSEWVKALHCLINARVAASEAARQVSQCFGIAKNQAYKVALKIQEEKKSEGG